MRYLIILLACVHLSASGQSWCAPGATWRFNLLLVYGYIEYSYAGDTLLDGMEAQVIDRASVLQYPQPPPQPPSDPQYSYTPVAFITRNEGDLVYQWSAQSQTWDTLFWWSAQIGDHWMMAHATDGCEPFEVLDIGTIEVDGVELRWLLLNNVSGTIIERIGSPWEFLPFCPPGHIDGMAGLRCYTDDEIHYQSGSWNYGCTSLVSIDEVDREKITLFPNPGTDHFTLSAVEGQLPSGPHQLTLFDAQGRVVLRQQLSEERPVISTSSLPSGIYHIHVTGGQGRSSGQRWIKE